MHPLALIFVRTGWYLVIGLVFGALSFQRTWRYRQATGKSPWGIHPVIWGLVSVPIAIFGTLLSIIACQTSGGRARGRVGRGGQGGGYGAPGGLGQQGGGWNAQGGGWGGAQGTPGQGYGTSLGYGSAQPPYGSSAGSPAGAAVPSPGFGSQAQTAGAAQAPPASPATWAADPSGRHEYRYYDGTQWTEHVSNNGVASTDPVHPGQ